MEKTKERQRQKRRSAAKLISDVERTGGIIMKCGCFLHAKTNDLRIYLETVGPKNFLEVINSIEQHTNECNMNHDRHSD
jgi:hypothetical protein